ncbi:hypothetical protein [Culicoidibacter larvae]|uniref:DUF1871 family protein n=1 Tax=Culicoidibacter larvae TaxID=2579976 RepID=A0A5R8QG07_9FIRM|nr:hypothetical protein [Culicoidibacter larvae]TLG76696.1 hypothetical protein FEZ08_03520 [Culicoidibacter larvae]
MDNILKKVINDWDPVEIIFSEMSADEYSAEISNIKRYILNDYYGEVTTKQLGVIIYKIFMCFFSKDIFTKDILECEAIAEKILDELSFISLDRYFEPIKNETHSYISTTLVCEKSKVSEYEIISTQEQLINTINKNENIKWIFEKEALPSNKYYDLEISDFDFFNILHEIQPILLRNSNYMVELLIKIYLKNNDYISIKYTGLAEWINTTIAHVKIVLDFEE